MNYDDMQAGPEMDRLIAEKVMGWKWHETRSTMSPSHWVDRKRNARFIGQRFEPSIQMAHAWEVVDHMTQTTKETWEFHVTTTLHVAIFEFDGGRDRPWKPGQYIGQALTMPLAICRAALMAITA